MNQRPSINLNEPVGHYLQKEFTALRADQTVADAFYSLRQAEMAERIVYFYVVDRAGRLVGVLPTRRFLVSPPEQVIGGIMIAEVIALEDGATVREALEAFLRHRFLAFPVVDAERRLLGVVDVGLFTDELSQVAHQHAQENIFQLIGVHLEQGGRFSPWRSFRRRFPWLLCNISGGLACALLAALFEELLDAVVVLALFIPVVLALAESVSIQAVTLTLQGLGGGRVNPAYLLRALAREGLTALLLGAGAGALVGALVWIWKGAAAVALAVGATIAGSMLTACLLGVALPLTVRALRGDPRIAAGPIVLASADLVTILLYFTVAGWMLR